MYTTTFLKGLIIGLSIAAPVGPIGVLCIQRTIAYGRTSGLLTGLGAATADGIYGGIAAFGLTVISGFLVHQQSWFSLIGGVFLLYLGIKTFLSHPAENVAVKGHKGYLYDYASTVLLTLANPATILSFVAIFAGLGLGSVSKGILPAVLMTIGVITGSALWWFILSGGVSLFSTKLKPSFLGMINKASGIILIAFAIFAFTTIIHK
jgi:threonine/homoserine/homoserine lactone efflux protein